MRVETSFSSKWLFDCLRIMPRNTLIFITGIFRLGLVNPYLSMVLSPYDNPAIIGSLLFLQFPKPMRRMASGTPAENSRIRG